MFLVGDIWPELGEATAKVNKDLIYSLKFYIGNTRCRTQMEILAKLMYFDDFVIVFSDGLWKQLVLS